MPAPRGNTYWKLAKEWKTGKTYTPTQLWDKAIEYFDWMVKEPMHEEKVFSNGKKIKCAKLRPMTIRSFCIFASIARSTFYIYEQNQDYIDIIARIKDVIFVQKFEGAAAGLFETNIIARELGLIDKQQVDLTNRDVADSPLNELSTEQLLEIEKIIAK